MYSICIFMDGNVRKRSLLLRGYILFYIKLSYGNLLMFFPNVTIYNSKVHEHSILDRRVTTRNIYR